MKVWKQHLHDGNLDIFVDITTHCNAGCPQCHRTDKNGCGKIAWLPLTSWTFEKFKKVYPPSIMQRSRHVSFCGTWGDPVMNKEIKEMVLYTLENQLKAWHRGDYDTKLLNSRSVDIKTNGDIRSAKWWRELGEDAAALTQKYYHESSPKTQRRILESPYWNIPHLQVVFAVEGITNEMHAKYRQKTRLDKVLRNMSEFAKQAPRVRPMTFTVVHKHNQDYLAEIEHLVKMHGSMSISFNENNRFQHTSDAFEFVNAQGEPDAIGRPDPDVSQNERITLARGDFLRLNKDLINSINAIGDDDE